MDARIAALNEEITRHGSGIIVAANFSDGILTYRISKVKEAFLSTQAYELILALTKCPEVRRTHIDLSDCRVVSSLELTLIGYIAVQTRFHGGGTRIICPSPVNRRALGLAGFDKLSEVVEN